LLHIGNFILFLESEMELPGDGDQVETIQEEEKKSDQVCGRQ